MYQKDGIIADAEKSVSNYLRYQNPKTQALFSKELKYYSIDDQNTIVNEAAKYMNENHLASQGLAEVDPTTSLQTNSGVDYANQYAIVLDFNAYNQSTEFVRLY